MKPIESAIENQIYRLHDLELKLKSLGFVIGSNWEYDHGYFDYQMTNDGTYYFLRIPFRTEIGQLDEPGAQVRMGAPFILGHQYESGTDEEAVIGNFTASINQFQAPKDPDTNVPNEYVEKGNEIIKRVEGALLT
ncbi:YugN-like family protein [Salirhabdus sp. Marseille-P4669]|uniref:YugN-like family protein n=1 Tax=Salirhabdus sp. Marseille-P4669 TaxID=2042310 RepID=UPI000C7C7CB9|nr:YugN-like family protein [Salirhabdus sp. Marseille-P4669]